MDLNGNTLVFIWNNCRAVSKRISKKAIQLKRPICWPDCAPGLCGRIPSNPSAGCTRCGCARAIRWRHRRWSTTTAPSVLEAAPREARAELRMQRVLYRLQIAADLAEADIGFAQDQFPGGRAHRGAAVAATGAPWRQHQRGRARAWPVVQYDLSALETRRLNSAARVRKRSPGGSASGNIPVEPADHHPGVPPASGPGAPYSHHIGPPAIRRT